LLRESAAKLPESAEVQYHLGMVHYRLGNRAEAGRALTRSLELDPSHSGAEEARQTLQQLR
ncbi:MAG TPA: tetratricopeptide repeat protein, partial [Vicinamibacteria bacterium]